MALPKTTGSSVGAYRLLASGAGIWVSDGLSRIDPTTLRASPPLDTVSGDDLPFIAADDSSLWGSNYDSGLVRRFQVSSGRLVASVPLDTPEGIAVTPAGVWVASHHGGTVNRINPQTNTIDRVVVLGPPGANGPQGLATGLGSVWAGVPNQQAVFRVNPQTGAIVAKITYPSGFDPCGDIAIGTASVWVSECYDGTRVGRIDPATNAFTLVHDTGGNVEGLAAAGDQLWFVTSPDPNSPTAAGTPSLERLGPDGTVDRKVAIAPGFLSGGILSAFGFLWIVTDSRPVVLRLPAT